MFRLAAQKLQPGRHLLGMPFGMECFFALFAAAVNLHFQKVEQFHHEAGSEERNRFLRIGRVALRAVIELAARTVRKFNLRANAVRRRQFAAGRPGGLRGNMEEENGKR